MTTFAQMDATELSQRLRKRELTAVEATRAALECVERFNPAVNAMVTTLADGALASAEAADKAAADGRWMGPLHGVPVAIKDLFDFKAGVRNTFGCPATAGFVPEKTSSHIRVLEEAGAIVIGKTNTPEFGHKGTTDNRLFGPTSTPFDTSRNAGGSSGGSAAAVAVGMAPLAQGSDAGGSIRIPAAWCGVVGLKLTFGRAPNAAGVNAFAPHAPFVHNGPIARTVRDAALMGQVMTAQCPDDPFCLPDDGMDLVGAVDADPSGLRIAYSRDLGVFAVEDEVARVVDECVADLRNSGMRVEEVDIRLPLDQNELAQLWLREVGVMYLEMFDAMAAGGLDLLRDAPHDIPEHVHRMVDHARRATVLSLRRDEAARSQVWRAVQALFAEYDALVTPTAAAMPTLNSDDGRTLGPVTIGQRAVEPQIGWCLTHPFNFTGHPAASVPAGLSSSGLPVGLQVAARRFADEHVISICRRVEQARPWLGDLDAARARLSQSAVGAATST